jgi:hypothetical protein
MKTNELTGAALDWAVAQCEGTKVLIIEQQIVWPEDYEPSTKWALGGPIIERERMDIECWDFHSMPWKASMWWDDENSAADIQMIGPTPLIAAMRCYVASKLGEEVAIPKELAP